MKHPLLPVSALAAALAFVAAAAHAQIDVSVNDQAFTGRAAPVNPDPNGDPAAAFVTGDGDLLLLDDRKHFNVRSVTDFVYTSNARLSDDNRVDDTYLREEVALRASTRLDQTWDVYAEGGAVFTRFSDETDLNSDTLFARIGASTPWSGGTVGGSLTGNFIYEDGFGDQLIDQLVLTGFYLKPYRLGDDWTLSTRVVASQTWADPHDFTNARLTLGADLIRPVHRRVVWISGVDVYGSWYADYFSGSAAVNDDRHDYGLRARTELRWNLCDNAALRGVLGYNLQDSSIGFLDYGERTAGLSLLLTMDF